MKNKVFILLLGMIFTLTFSTNYQAADIEAIRIETDYPSVTRQGFLGNKVYEIRTPWEAYSGEEKLSEQEFLRLLGEEELASEAASFHSTKTIYTFGGFGLAAAGLGLAGSQVYSGEIEPAILIGGSALGLTGGFLASYGMNLPFNYLKVNEAENLIESAKYTAYINIEPSMFVSVNSFGIAFSGKF